jgi:hypothetical protein
MLVKLVACGVEPCDLGLGRVVWDSYGPGDHSDTAGLDVDLVEGADALVEGGERVDLLALAAPDVQEPTDQHDAFLLSMIHGR